MHGENLFKTRERHNSPYVLKEDSKAIFEGCKFKSLNTYTDNDSNLLKVYLSFSKGTEGFSFYLSQLPFNCGMIVIGHLRGFITQDIIKMIVALCKKMGYTIVLHTDNNTFLSPDLKAVGFKSNRALSVVNMRSRNKLTTHVYKITE